MEPVIAVLAPHVIDQIAAGEVIERPASVVKELVDNAIDAGASSIAIDVAGGGRALVRVSDDGCGMTAKDAVLSLERHATSKLREVDDLWGLQSMGFRGEALPSIASVSRMTLTTRRAGDDAATRIVVEAGRLLSVTDAGAPVGTTVEVADLLYNLPARLKFLKGEATEASHITELVGKLAMAYPRLHLRLRHNGRTALDAPPDRDGFARAQALLGPRIAARLVPVSGEEAGVRVTAYLAAPELAQATARGVQLFVGRRPVRDRGLLHALAMGYGELVPRGRYPVAIVLLDLPLGTVDVNVHPQKLEVRFTDPATVAAAVRHVVQSGITAARWRDSSVGSAPVQLIGMMGAGGVAAPPLPFDERSDAGSAGHGGFAGGAGRSSRGADGMGATRLAERYVAEMRSRQVSLGFAAPEVTAGAAGAGRAASTAAPRDWARSLREQTQASRAAEPPVVYQAGAGVAAPTAASYPSLPSLGGRSRSAPPVDGGSPIGGSEALRGDPGGDASELRAPICDAMPGDAHARAVPEGEASLANSTAVSASRAGHLDALPASDAGVGEAGERAGDAGVGGAQLGGAQLGGAQLGGAQVGGVQLGGAQVSGAQLGDARVGGAQVGADARAANAWAPESDARIVELPRLPPPRRLAAGTAPIEPQANRFFSQLRYLGQLDLTYLACEGDGELVLIDQHAAHERVELARLRDRHAEGGDARVAVQNMLFPVTLEATPAQLALVARVGTLLAEVGFEVEPFGKTTLAVKAVPAGIRHGDPSQLLRRLLQDWADAGAPSEAERLDALLGAIACHSVVRAGDRLTPGEAETLLRSLDGIDLSLPAPHGRAVLLRLPLAEIGRRFGR